MFFYKILTLQNALKKKHTHTPLNLQNSASVYVYSCIYNLEESGARIHRVLDLSLIEAGVVQ